MASPRPSRRALRVFMTMALMLFAALAFAVPASASLGSITGKIFTDTNNNGVLDVGEAGYNGASVFLDLDMNGTFGGSDVSATADSSGVFTFTNVSDGAYSVMLTVPANYGVTGSNPASTTVTAGSN